MKRLFSAAMFFIVVSLGFPFAGSAIAQTPPQVSVFAFQELREHINQPEIDFLRVGYHILVPNNGTFGRVRVITPWNESITMIPVTGRTHFAFDINGAPASSNILTLSVAPVNPAAYATLPADFRLEMPHIIPLWRDDQVQALANEGTWRFEFFNRDNATNVPTTSTNYTTKVRPLSTTELKTIKFPGFEQGFIQALREASRPYGYAGLKPDPLPMRWEVPAGAFVPTQVGIHGRSPIPPNSPPGTGGQPFEDVTSVTATQRTAAVRCSPAAPPVADTHCAATTGGATYAAGTIINNAFLLYYDPNLRFQTVHAYSTYRLPAPR